METGLAVKLVRPSTRIYDVPVVYRGRTYAEGKKISWTDGLAAVYVLVRYRFSGSGLINGLRCRKGVSLSG